MNKQLKIYFFITILGIISLFSFIMFIKYIIDPVGLNNKFNLGLFKDINLAYRTQKFVELNEIKPNTLIIGGSRVHYIQTSDVEKYTKDKVYNLGLPYSTLEEQYYFLKYSLENLDIKNVLIGINFYTFSNKLQKRNSDFDKEIFDNGFNFYRQFKHYLDIPIINYFKYIYKNENLKEKFYENGSITPRQENLTLKTDLKIRMDSSYYGYKNTYKNYLDFKPNEYNINMEYFKKMVDLCKQYNVNYKIFTTAIHNKQLNIIKEVEKTEEYYSWKEELSKITPYWDFMYNHTITNNDDIFIDTSHIKHNFLYNYLSKLFDDKNINVPKDFGVYVNDKNIKEHLNYLKKVNNF